MAIALVISVVIALWIGYRLQSRRIIGKPPRIQRRWPDENGRV